MPADRRVKVEPDHSEARQTLERIRARARAAGTLHVMQGESKPSALPTPRKRGRPKKPWWQRERERLQRGSR